MLLVYPTNGARNEMHSRDIHGGHDGHLALRLCIGRLHLADL